MIIDVTREELEIELSRACSQEVKIEFTELENANKLEIFLKIGEDVKKVYSLTGVKEKGEEYLYRLFLLWAAADGFTLINKHLLTKEFMDKKEEVL